MNTNELLKRLHEIEDHLVGEKSLRGEPSQMLRKVASDALRKLIEELEAADNKKRRLRPERQREADRVDGFDRDDLGESFD